MLSVLAAVLGLAGTVDTTRLQVGSPEVNGRVYAPHKARVRVHVGELSTPPTAEWVNELTLGDSAGRKVMRWVTTGTRDPGGPNQTTWELRQTYDAVSLAPLGFASKSSAGGYSSLVIDGTRVKGVRKAPADSAPTQVDYTIDRPGFMASASDLVPLAVGLEKGRVMTAPVWSPGSRTAETRTFAVLGEEDVDVEGTRVRAWKVEERKADGTLYATWWLTRSSPYMVYGEVPLPDGRVQRMTEVEVR